MSSNQDDSRPRRKKMLSFEPNADFFVVDQNAPPAATTATEGRRDGTSTPTELMGPILRRKKVVSMPLGDPRRNDFFTPLPPPRLHTGTIDEAASATEDGSLGPLPNLSPSATAASRSRRQRQHTAPTSGGFFQVDYTPPSSASGGATTTPTRRSGRKKTNSFMAGLLARRAVGLDLLPSEEAEIGVYEFFSARGTEEELPSMPEGSAVEEAKEEMVEEEEGVVASEQEEGEVSDESFREQGGVKTQPKLFKPLVFAPRVIAKGVAGTGHGHGGVGHSMPPVTPTPVPKEDVVAPTDEVVIADGEDNVLPSKENGYEEEGVDDEAEKLIEQFDHSHVIRATRKDYFFTGMLFLVMTALTGVVLGWHTHLDESDSIFGPVGLACKTPCRGDIYDQDYFRGQYSFAPNDVILLIPHIDTTLTENSFLKLMIRGVVSNKTKWTSPDDLFGPASVEGERVSMTERVVVDWENPEEPHVIDVISTTGNPQVPPPYYEVGYHVESFDNATHEAAAAVATHETDSSSAHRTLESGGDAVHTAPDVPHHGELTFNLYAATLHPMASSSVLVAGLIMIFVYLFILLEVIHRTLVAIFGSFVALFFFFMMHGGHTESISTLMLHMEWSTLGLLFGMMLLVGELSHTGVFEWCAVRLLIMSKGSFNRLIVLLCGLVALSSAFLDNVTTMLLIAPVTIDMCHILGVDPRPYLIGEVLLSNVGGTATLIGVRSFICF